MLGHACRMLSHPLKCRKQMQLLGGKKAESRTTAALLAYGWKDARLEVVLPPLNCGYGVLVYLRTGPCPVELSSFFAVAFRRFSLFAGVKTFVNSLPSATFAAACAFFSSFAVPSPLMAATSSAQRPISA